MRICWSPIRLGRDRLFGCKLILAPVEYSRKRGKPLIAAFSISDLGSIPPGIIRRGWMAPNRTTQAVLVTSMRRVRARQEKSLKDGGAGGKRGLAGGLDVFA